MSQDDVFSKTRAGMERAIDALKKDFGKVRTGRASIALLDDVRIDYYGTPTPLNQVGTLAVPEPRLITIQPWEKKLIPEIQKAILKSDLGVNPSSDGQLVRIAIPPPYRGAAQGNGQDDQTDGGGGQDCRSQCPARGQ